MASIIFDSGVSQRIIITASEVSEAGDVPEERSCCSSMIVMEVANAKQGGIT